MSALEALCKCGFRAVEHDADMRCPDDADHARANSAEARPASVPANAKLLTMPYSEVCCHMQVAERPMWVAPVGPHMAQLYNLDGTKFSFPVTRGEAGLPYDLAA